MVFLSHFTPMILFNLTTFLKRKDETGILDYFNNDSPPEIMIMESSGRKNYSAFKYCGGLDDNNLSDLRQTGMILRIFYWIDCNC